MPRIAPAVVAACLAAIACTSEAEPAASPTPDRPPTVTIIGENIELLPGEDLALRIGFGAAEAAAQVIVTFSPDDARVSVCPIAGIQGAIERSTCRATVGSGVREPVSARDMSAVAIVLDGDAAATADVLIEYAERTRDVAIAIPRLRPPMSSRCADNACNPFFEVLPVRAGPFTARATWQGPPASLVLLQGSVRGRSLTATGVPYREPARDDGGSPLTLSTSLTAPAEYAIAFHHRALRPGEEPLRNVLIEASYPLARD